MKKLYHLSKENLDGKTLTPRIPKGHFVDLGYEDGKFLEYVWHQP